MQKQLSVYEAADLLGLSVHTLRAYTCRRKVPFRKLGARVVFDPVELEKWAQQRAVKPVVR